MPLNSKRIGDYRLARKKFGFLSSSSISGSELSVDTNAIENSRALIPHRKVTQNGDCTNLNLCFVLRGPESKQVGQVPKTIAAPPSDQKLKNGVRPLWADKHCPRSLSSFQCNARQILQLKQLTSLGNCPHLLLRGPPGAGKRALVTALVHDLFGGIKALPEHRHFSVQGGEIPSITVPITSSRYHVEVDLRHINEFDKDVLPTIFKEIDLSSLRSRNSPLKAQSDFGYKVLVLQNAERLSVDAQRILRRLMDRYRDTCKVILCCNVHEIMVEPVIIGEGLRSRCQIVEVEVPTQEEIVKVLSAVAKKEDVNLPKAFAIRIADQCKQSLRKAIVQLEACRYHQYPFTDDQPVQSGAWEEDVIQIAATIFSEPTLKSLFLVRESLQAMLLDCISPVLILQKLLEEFLQRTELQLKRQICHWAGFYETRLQTLSNPMGQLEAFLSKLVSIYKTHVSSRARPNLKLK